MLVSMPVPAFHTGEKSLSTFIYKLQSLCSKRTFIFPRNATAFVLFREWFLKVFWKLQGVCQLSHYSCESL